MSDLEQRSKAYADNKHRPGSQEWYLAKYAYEDSAREQAKIGAELLKQFAGELPLEAAWAAVAHNNIMLAASRILASVGD